MAAPARQGAPRPASNAQQVAPPNFNPNFQNPNALADNMQNLNLNRPPSMPSPGLRPPPPFGQSPPFPTSSPSPGFPPGQSPVSRPGPPPAALRRPVGPPPGSQPSALASNLASGRPMGPPVGRPISHPSPFSAGPRPSPMAGPGMPPPVPPPTSLAAASPQGGSPLAPPGGRPGAFGPAPAMLSGPVSNGPPTLGPGALPGGTGVPPASTAQPPFMPAPPAMPARGPPQSPGMRPALGGLSASSGLASPAPFPGVPQGRPPASGLTQTWPMQPQQAASVPPFARSMQPQGMYGMPPPPNQSMTNISPAMGQSGASPSGSSKIDPNQIPRPGPSMTTIIHETRSGNQANPPPPATSDYIVRDTGNCSPRYMRCTINQVPCTSDLLSTSAMQLALIVQPLALPHPSEEPIQIVDFGENGPVRCSRCKGYINPFMKFIDQGRRFICNLCGFTDETPRDYHCNLGPDGRRRDADERPELCRGTVEFVATREYMVRDPMPAVYFFLIDVSMNAVQTGGTAAACNAISQVLSDLRESPRTFVGIATFDSTIHFYNLRRALQQPLMLIVPDVQDVYTPLETDVIVQLSECRQHLELLLESIPSMFQNSKTPESAFGAAVQAAYLAMKSTGGKLLVFQSVLSSFGIGALSSREAEGRANISAGEKEAHKLLQPADKTLKTMAIEFAEYQVCVDLFITTQSYVDIASISVIPRTTGGQVYHYYPFSAISDSAKLYNDLRWNITRPQGFEAVMRVRCSQGLQVQDYSGNFCRRIPTDIDLPAIDCDKAIMVTLKHDDKLQDGAECAFQCALLYTTVDGQRRIRVTTLSLPCTSMLSNLFRSADLDAQFACLLKQAASDIPTKPLMQVKDLVTNASVNTLLAYRKFCATVTSSGQLILPEALKLLPLFTLALTKSAGLRNDGRIDDRSFWVNRVSSLSTPLAIPLVYPRMIAVHELNTEDNNDGPVIPSTIPLSSEHVNDKGVYFLENGEDGLIYVGDSVDPETLQQLFGVSSIDGIAAQFVLQQYNNPLSVKFNDIVNEIRAERCSYLRLKLCRKGDPSGMLFFSHLVEDKSVAGPSYVEFLVHVHRQIQLKMS